VRVCQQSSEGETETDSEYAQCLCISLSFLSDFFYCACLLFLCVLWALLPDSNKSIKQYIFVSDIAQCPVFASPGILCNNTGSVCELNSRVMLSCTHSNQSTATMRLMSETGRPTDVRTRIIITRPALGILAAPILASVAVRLAQQNSNTYDGVYIYTVSTARLHDTRRLDAGWGSRFKVSFCLSNLA